MTAQTVVTITRSSLCCGAVIGLGGTLGKDVGIGRRCVSSFGQVIHTSVTVPLSPTVGLYM